MIVIKKGMIVLISTLIMQLSSFAAVPARMVIFPFTGTNRNAAFSWIGEGAALSVSEQLKETGLGVLSRDERIDLIERNDLPSNTNLSRGSMILVAQRAGADYAVMGSVHGNEQNLKLSVWVLNMQSLSLSGEITVTGPLAALQQMENDLAWMILSSLGLDTSRSREKFRERSRKESNLAYAYYIQSLDASDEKEKIPLLEKALQAYAAYPDARFQLGRLYYQNREYSKAVTHFMISANDSKNRIPSMFFLGNCYLQEDKSALALQAFSRVLSFSRRYDILNNLAVARLRSGDLATATQSLVEANSLAPNNSTIVFNLAILRHLTGNNASAVTLLENALKVHPDSGMLHFLLGIIMKSAGDNERSSRAMAKARDMGIQVDSLLRDPPRSWLHIFHGWSDFKPSISAISAQ